MVTLDRKPGGDAMVKILQILFIASFLVMACINVFAVVFALFNGSRQHPARTRKSDAAGTLDPGLAAQRTVMRISEDTESDCEGHGFGDKGCEFVDAGDLFF